MNQIDQTILEWTAVAARTGLTWDQLLQMEAAGTFPARIPDESGQIWRREDVENWIRKRDERRNRNSLKPFSPNSQNNFRRFP